MPIRVHGDLDAVMPKLVLIDGETSRALVSALARSYSGAASKRRSASDAVNGTILSRWSDLSLRKRPTLAAGFWI